VPRKIVPSVAVPLRLQVPGEDDGGDHVPAALLLPEAEQHDPDPLPDRVQVRQAGHVRADAVRGGHVCVLRGQEVVRPVPQGALLQNADVVGAVPGRVFLPGSVGGAEAVPAEPVVPCGIVEGPVICLFKIQPDPVTACCIAALLRIQGSFSRYPRKLQIPRGRAPLRRTSAMETVLRLTFEDLTLRSDL